MGITVDEYYKMAPKRTDLILSIINELGHVRSPVLDIGCGFGWLILKICGRVEQRTAIGIDLNFEKVLIAKEKAEQRSLKVNFVVCDATKLPFKENKYRLIFCNMVIEHIPNQGRFISEIYRVLRRNGILYVATVNRFWPVEEHLKLFLVPWMPRKMGAIYSKLRKGTDYYKNVYLLTPMQLKRMLMKTKFNVNSTNYILIEHYHSLPKYEMIGNMLFKFYLVLKKMGLQVLLSFIISFCSPVCIFVCKK